MQKSLKDILGQNASPIMTQEELAEKLFRGVITARAFFDKAYAKEQSAQNNRTAQPNTTIAIYAQAIKDKAQELCADEHISALLKLAFQMDADALDQSCALIMPIFMPENVIDNNYVLGMAGTPAGNGEHAIPSAKSTLMKRHLNGRADEFITIHNRMMAGPVFGFAASKEERAELDLHLIRIMRDSLLAGVQSNTNSSPPQAGIE